MPIPHEPPDSCRSPISCTKGRETSHAKRARQTSETPLSRAAVRRAQVASNASFYILSSFKSVHI